MYGSMENNIGGNQVQNTLLDSEMAKEVQVTEAFIEIKISENEKKLSKLSNWIDNFTCDEKFFKIFVIFLSPLILWAFAFTLNKNEAALFEGNLFILIVLFFAGRTIGYFISFLKLPPMVGMLGIGLLIRNTPHFDFGKHLNPQLSAPIRQIALAVILTRAGLGLNLDILIKMKGLVTRMALLPTLAESIVVAFASHLILNFPLLWGLLLGFVLAAVSPAVVVPRLLELKEDGFGVEKNIPTVLIAAASLDNIFAITLFGVTLGLIMQSTPAGNSLLVNIFHGPLEIIYGLSFGLIWGTFLGFLFNKSQKENDNIKALRAFFTFIGGTSFLLGFNQLGYSGAGALGCLTSAFTAACLWNKRNVTRISSNTMDPVSWIFSILWFIFEPLLFGVIGSAIDLYILEPNLIFLGTICILIGAVTRFLVCYLASYNTDLNVKEKLFMGIAYFPKATVQAAIGPTALNLATNLGKSAEDKILGQKVLTLAVLIILLTAPLGELCLLLLGPKLLKRKKDKIEENSQIKNV